MPSNGALPSRADRVADAALDRCLVFAGFMGAGKTTCAGEAARLLGVPVRDVDAGLSAAFGEPIEAFWEREGEPAFREREEHAVLEALDGEPAVVALGGGALGSERVREALRAHTVVLVEVDLETAWSRVAGSGHGAAIAPAPSQTG